MTVTVTGSYKDASDSIGIAAYLVTLGVTSSEVIVIPVSSTKVYLAKVVIT